MNIYFYKNKFSHLEVLSNSPLPVLDIWDGLG